jgi:hypothetical protein
MKKSIIAGVALAAVGTASAALVTMPDMSGGGDFTLAAGDSWVNTAGTVLGGQGNSGTVTINGDWIAAEAFEVVFGGVNLDDATDFTLNIGSTGSVDISKLWMSVTDTAGTAITATINIATGGTYGRATTGQFTRYRYPSNAWNNTVERLWDDGALLRDGQSKADLLAAGEDEAFTSNFDVTGDIAGAFTMQAIPEPGTLGLIGVFGGGMLFIRRRFMI